MQWVLDGSLQQREDPEDVVQTVLRTYFRRAALGEFQIADSSDLWALLAKITRRKILKRGVPSGGKTRHGRGNGLALRSGRRA